MRAQLNVRLAKSTRKHVKDDRKSNPRATNDVIVEVAIEDFFSKYTPAQRAAFYRNHNYAPYSRNAA